MLTMRLLDVTLKTPAANLALEEVLLNEAEDANGGEVLRFWQSSTPFVVLGVSQALRQHVDVAACEADGIPVLRRCSAGGCVLQGPGCLNYTLVLSQEARPDIGTLRGSYCHILRRVSEALQGLGVNARHKGISDLALRGKKVSGSSQKRRRRFILHHGTLLFRADPEHMERYLREPDERPQYRGERTHRGFVTNLPVEPDLARQAIRDAFEAGPKPSKLTAAEQKAVKVLVDEKYAASAWNQRR
ncbi:MAG: lipoate--protein ligase family protein [bacterium]|nr:lipoate--protein ligase family protein [bacterium]